MFVWLCVCVVLVPLFDSIQWNDGETLANCKFHVSYTSTMHINTWNSSANYTNRPPSNNLHNISPVESSSYFFWFVHFLRCAVIETRAMSMNEHTNIENHSIRPALSLAYSTDDCFVQLFANKRDNRVHIMVFYGILVVHSILGWTAIVTLEDKIENDETLIMRVGVVGVCSIFVRKTNIDS